MREREHSLVAVTSAESRKEGWRKGRVAKRREKQRKKENGTEVSYTRVRV